MIYQSILFFLAAVLQLTAASSTFLSLNSHRYQQALNDETITSLKTLASLADSEEPLVCLRFEKFDLLGQLGQKNAQAGFLTSFFEDSLTRVLDQDESFVDLEDPNTSVLKVDEIPSAAFELLYEKVNRKNAVVAFDFTAASYDLESLEEYLESVYLYLEETLANIDNFVVQVPTSDASSYTEDQIDAAVHGTNVEVSDPENPSKGGKSTGIWTDGLISCLIVSLLLLWILVTAIAWITSLDISYGALEKPTNPLKKTN